MVIAGHRYLKAGQVEEEKQISCRKLMSDFLFQRLHALRCYNDVVTIYGLPNWSLAFVSIP